MHKLYEFICDELKELEKKSDNGLSVSEIQLMDTLLHAKKNLLKAEEMEEESEYSGAIRDGMMYRDGMRGGSYRGRYEGSYARGRGRNAKRDSMGRYSSEGYSRAADDVVERMRDLMQDAPDEQTRQEIQRLVSRMESMM
jgi:hypothetical protein